MTLILRLEIIQILLRAKVFKIPQGYVFFFLENKTWKFYTIGKIHRLDDMHIRKLKKWYFLFGLRVV